MNNGAFSAAANISDCKSVSAQPAFELLECGLPLVAQKKSFKVFKIILEITLSCSFSNHPHEIVDSTVRYLIRMQLFTVWWSKSPRWGKLKNHLLTYTSNLWLMPNMVYIDPHNTPNTVAIAV